MGLILEDWLWKWPRMMVKMDKWSLSLRVMVVKMEKMLKNGPASLGVKFSLTLLTIKFFTIYVSASRVSLLSGLRWLSEERD